MSCIGDHVVLAVRFAPSPHGSRALDVAHRIVIANEQKQRLRDLVAYFLVQTTKGREKDGQEFLFGHLAKHTVQVLLDSGLDRIGTCALPF